MYERFYNLRERPFSLTPDPDYLFLSRVHREGLNHLRYGVESHAGFVVITGEIGCGKTTLLQTVLRSLDQQTAISRLVNTSLDARELIEAVMLDFGLKPPQGQSKPFLLRDLACFLVDQRNAGRNVLLVIDEAQNLSESALEEVRMLSNLETEKSKLIQIVLIGQPNLRDLLARPSLEQFRQRVTVNYHLQPMDRAETAAYINHRLRRAAIWIPLTFPEDVTDLIYRYSKGVARKVNIIADAVLLFGYGANKSAIDLPLAQEVIEELGCKDQETAVTAAAQAPASEPTASVPVAFESAVSTPVEQVAIREPVANPDPIAVLEPVPMWSRDRFGNPDSLVAMREPAAIPEPVATPQPVAAREPVEIAEPVAIPEPVVMREPVAIPAPVMMRESVAVPEPVAIPAPVVMREPVAVPRPVVIPDSGVVRERVLSRPVELPLQPRANGSVAFAPSYRVLSEHHHHTRSQSVWRRLWRGLLGTPKPVFEE